MKILAYLAGAFALTYAMTSCEPGMPLTVSGYYKSADGSKSGLSTTFVPIKKIHAEK